MENASGCEKKKKKKEKADENQPFFFLGVKAADS
jgi:hypothetical protein